MRKMIFTIFMISSSLFATNYADMSIDELRALKGSVPESEKAIFREAMQSKMQNLSPQEKDTYKNSNSYGSTQRLQLQDGTGSGNMYKGSRGGGFGGGGGRH
jgi:hypothetical protein